VTDRGRPLAALLDDVRAAVTRYVVVGPHEAVAVSLWVAHCWVLDAFDATGYLEIRSPVRRCGKSTLMDVIELLVPRPWKTIEPSEAVFYRKIEKSAPTLLLDEVDAIFAFLFRTSLPTVRRSAARGHDTIASSEAIRRGPDSRCDRACPDMLTASCPPSCPRPPETPVLQAGSMPARPIQAKCLLIKTLLEITAASQRQKTRAGSTRAVDPRNADASR
jgi:hypothetical protein